MFSPRLQAVFFSVLLVGLCRFAWAQATPEQKLPWGEDPPLKPALERARQTVADQSERSRSFVLEADVVDRAIPAGVFLDQGFDGDGQGLDRI